ncbi:hypothetical protein [Baaleninema simplex]|uniref:hypothetical protein n=1 Tax=Baaleninema simplex TaxID=2862350 RepID=UPI00034ABA0A|nr:hypothetical protein [Baaleninema simplex]
MENLFSPVYNLHCLAVILGRSLIIFSVVFLSTKSALAGILNPLSSPFKLASPLSPISETGDLTPCSSEPSGFGFPGFQPGTLRSHVEEMVGAPMQVQPGYWGNTTALIYNLIPKKVSLGFLFDNTSDRLRQTEASFAQSVDRHLILSTLDSMLGCQLDTSIRQGFDRVWTREISAYSFSLPSLEGTIAWENETRVYIGIWQDDLH